MKQLSEVLDKLQIRYSEEMLEQFRQYMELILDWNEKVNLTSITDKSEFIQKHYVDSVVVCAYDQFKEAERIIDVGTGAGFPGIPLAILNPDKSFFLIDSLGKRIKIIREIAEKLQIDNVAFHHGRAEDLAHQSYHRESYDLCVSRAVANLSVLSEYCLPFVQVGGWFAAYKSSNIQEEIKDSKRAINLLGGRLEENVPIKFDGYHLDHHILFIKKMEKTLSKFPRKAGTPAKEPLK